MKGNNNYGSILANYVKVIVETFESISKYA